MSRRKTKKPSAKRNQSKSSNAPQAVEKDFLNAPAKLAAQLSKDLAAHKQAEAKLKAAVAKLKASSQKNKTGAKAAAAKKSLAALTKQLQEVARSLNDVNGKLAKMNAIRKLLTQFEKDWAKKAKAVKAKKAKPAAKKSSSRKPKATIIELKQPALESFESSIDNLRVNSATESNS
jgi:phage shock protein A